MPPRSNTSGNHRYKNKSERDAFFPMFQQWRQLICTATSAQLQGKIKNVGYAIKKCKRFSSRENGKNYSHSISPNCWKRIVSIFKSILVLLLDLLSSLLEKETYLLILLLKPKQIHQQSDMYCPVSIGGGKCSSFSNGGLSAMSQCLLHLDAQLLCTQAHTHVW